MDNHVLLYARWKLPLKIFLEVALETPREKSRDLSGSKINIEFYLKTT